MSTTRKPIPLRRRKTSLRVKIADKLARFMISIAGLGTILAVSAIFMFLAWVVYPLFVAGTISPEGHLDDFLQGQAPLHSEVDDYQLLAWTLLDEGSMLVYRVDTGEIISRSALFAERSAPISHSIDSLNGQAAFGFDNGQIQTGRIYFDTIFLEFTALGPEFQAMQSGDIATYKDGVIQVGPTGQIRYQKVVAKLEEPIQTSDNSPIRLLDQSILPSGTVLASVDSDGIFRIQALRKTQNMMTGETTISASGGDLALDIRTDSDLPSYLVLEGRGDSTSIVWQDGRLLRLDTRDRRSPRVVENLHIFDEPNVYITALGTLIGKTTMVVGDSKGRLSTWFRTRPQDSSATGDASTLTRSQFLTGETSPSPVRSLAASKRTRMLLAGYEDGKVRLFHVTSSQLLSEAEVMNGQAVTALTFAPRDDGFIALSSSRASHWQVNFPHPQTTVASIIRPVWYESASSPSHIWQSSSGSDAFEPKYGLMPLIFGTLKATFYTMLFGTPLALLAALYTSEFMKPRLKARIKPTIEMMASLPSVVLGFMAALVFAPIVEHIVPAILLSFFMVPFIILLSAFIWQLIPRHISSKYDSLRLVIMCIAIPLALGLSLAFGSVVERVLFAGNIKAWLAFNGQGASALAAGTGGWILLFLPLSAIFATCIMVFKVNPHIMAHFGHFSREKLAAVNLVKFLCGTAICLLLAWAISAGLSTMGFDPRGTYLDNYVQRNALIVGFVMGFAVIPIIYTIADDALSSVPDYLRAASLGAGATPWQTAMRIIVPTAMSGLFSAVMIGLGRAVGETMIVLMAAGNTPVMDWNIFNGFRTLSANIAVELPEAVQYGTNFRMLFLAALTLFLMTFVVNTMAEIIRQRFRKKAFEL